MSAIELLELELMFKNSQWLEHIEYDDANWVRSCIHDAGLM